MSRAVAILAFDPCDTLDVVGPLEVFSFANQALVRLGSRRAGYTAKVVGLTRAPIRSESGLTIVPATTLAVVTRTGIDTLVVAGGAGARRACEARGALKSIERAAGRSRRVTAVCTGAFVLASLGLLDGRRATTHWAFCAELARRHPKVVVESDPIFVRDGAVWTSAGVTAGIDLALALVEHDLGREVAAAVARWLVVFVRRAGGQAQFSNQLSIQTAERVPIRDLLAFIQEHPDAPLTVPALAGRVGMSVRNFTRVFRAETGASPAAFVEGVRVETARRMLESTPCSVVDVASR
jgi:transcriptional regulator GlxA family with amidase domain